MGIDIKFPIGLMFAILGAVLTIYGFITKADPEIYQKSLDININLWTGIIMVAFGLFMLLFSIFQRKEEDDKQPTVNGKR
jgi:membrane-bound ClpP family serine protease